MKKSFFMKISLSVVTVLLVLSTAGASPFPSPALFQEPTQTSGIGTDAWCPSLTPDGQHMVFTSGGPHRLYSADWIGNEQKWGNIQLLDLGGGSWQSTASITSDGQWLFYNGSSGTGSNGHALGGNLYRSKKLSDGTWSSGELVSLGQDNVSHPFFDSVRGRLYFTIDPGLYDFDLAWINYDMPSNTTSGSVNYLTSVNTVGYEESFARIVGDGSTLIFARGLKDVAGSADIWIATWNTDTVDWNPPSDSGLTINSANNDEFSAWYCEARGTLYFSYVESPFSPDTAQVWESQAIPEPTTLLLLGLGGLVLRRNRK